MTPLVLALALGACAPAASGDEPPRLVPAAAVDVPAGGSTRQTAVFAGGCFWGVEAVFERVRGVVSVRSGYAGGSAADADYGRVSGGRTGHAEAVEIVYDPRVVTYGQLLRVFFSVAHDPTQLNRQGPDHGPQYRSHIFTLDDDQARVARAYIAQLDAADAYAAPIVTRVDPLPRFYAAEAYHQNFMAENPRHPYIVMHDAPKIAALERLFPRMTSAERVS
ncbi:MAG: peptide-methionine (S)-S-oxide reductase MsrA [Alphaproteobacteria bacterium]|nr:peptide-methionine (S)-S-oxide reductase MsrA [Alphaproteobacteria bacterium]